MAKATGLKIQQPFADKQYNGALRWLESSDAHLRGAALIAWHHGKLSKLLKKLGADPAAVLPGGRWLDRVYDWVVVLRYGHDGSLKEAKLVTEPTDLR